MGCKAHPSGIVDFPKRSAIKGRQQVDFPLQRVVHNKGIFLRRIVDPNGNILHPVPDGMKLPEQVSRLVSIVSYRNGIAGLDFLQRLGNGDEFGVV